MIKNLKDKIKGSATIKFFLMLTLVFLLWIFLDRNFIHYSKESRIKKDIRWMEYSVKVNKLLNRESSNYLLENERDLENLVNKGQLYNKRGLVKDINSDLLYQKIAPRKKKDIQSELRGDFYIDEDERVYYKKDIFESNPLSQIENYALTYKEVDQSNIELIKRFDMVILEPYNINLKEILEIEESHTKTYGYQTIFEIDQRKLAQDNVDLPEAAFLHLNGERVRSHYYDHYYGDIRSEDYRNYLFDSIEKNIVNKGFSGVFFDTLDDLSCKVKCNSSNMIECYL